MVTKQIRIAVGFLSYNRPVLLEKAIKSLVSKIGEETVLQQVVYDNGSSDDHLHTIKRIAEDNEVKFFGLGRVLAPTTSDSARETRFTAGHQALVGLLASIEADAYIIHEDDWECIRGFPLLEMVTFLRNNPQVGQLRLRRCKYDNSLTGYQTHNFVTGKKYQWQKAFPIKGGNIRIANLHWTNNPSLILPEALSVLRQMRPATELDRMRYFQDVYPNNAQVEPGAFDHTGEWRVRNDLIDKGIVRVSG